MGFFAGFVLGQASGSRGISKRNGKSEKNYAVLAIHPKHKFFGKTYSGFSELDYDSKNQHSSRAIYATKKEALRQKALVSKSYTGSEVKGKVIKITPKNWHLVERF